MNNPSSFCSYFFGRLFQLILKLELCWHACRHWDENISTWKKKRTRTTTTCRPQPKVRCWNVWNQIVSRNILSSLRYWLSSNTIIRGPFQNSNMVSPCKGCQVLIKDISNYFLLYLKLYGLFKCWTSLFACYFQTAVDRLIDEMRPVITSLLVRLFWILTNNLYR